MSNAPTPQQVAKALPALMRRVPAKIRGWLYLALIVAAVAFIGVTAWRQGFTTDQLVALVIAVYAGLSRANTNA